MDFMFGFIAIFVTIAMFTTIYYFFIGYKTKDYAKAKISLTIYVVANLIRLVLESIFLK